MNPHTIEQILRNIAERKRLISLEQQRLARLSEEERERERYLEGDAIQFLDIEAEESEAEEETDSVVEDGFEEAIDSLLPRDSRGIAYIFVKPHWKKLKQIRSDEYYDLSKRERREVVRRTRQWARITSRKR